MKDLPLIVATCARSAAVGAQMVREGRAYGCLYVEDRPGADGVVDVRYVVGPGHEHRMPELDAMIAKVAAQIGGVAIDAARLTKGAAA
jgi:hypothetical protein